MPPRRTRARKAQAPDPKQRAISDFFTARPSPAKPSPRGPLPDPTSDRSSSQQPPSHQPPSSSHEPPATQYRAAAAPRRPPRAKPPAPAPTPNDDPSDVGMDVDPAPRRRHLPSPPIEVDAMDVDPDPDEEPPLTQEELDVHAGLQALECSRDGPDERPAETFPTPPKRAADRKAAVLQKRKRTSPAASPEGPSAKPLPRGPLSAAGLSPDSDRDDATPPGLKSASSPASGTSASDKEDSDDDSYADLREHEQTVAVRRSSRIAKEVVRFDPDAVVTAKVTGSSVFGGSVFAGTRQAKSSAAALRVMARERSAREKEEQQIEEMRQNVDRQGQLGQREAVFDSMAKEEDKREDQRLANLEKYSAPLPLFSARVKMLEVPSKYRRSQPDGTPWHYLHDNLVEIFKAGENGDIALSLLGPGVARACNASEPADMFIIADIIFYLVVYDDTTRTPGRVSRDHLVESLELICRSRALNKSKSLSGQGRLPSLLSVLGSYGAVFEDPALPVTWKHRSAGEHALDSLSRNEDAATISESVEKASRNLKRACVITTARIRLRDKLHRAIGDEIRGKDKCSATLFSLGVCIRILLSAFGSRLHQEVGLIIVALLDRIKDAEWPQFRVKAAKYILSFTSRLGLHVELVTYLLPYSTKKSRFLAFDVAYLSLKQWSAGPGNDPQPKDVQNFVPTAKAAACGIEGVSYCIADVIELLKSVPELAKDTDIEWACGIARILKQSLADRLILDRRAKGEIGNLLQLLQKLRTCSHRMGPDVPVQDMRLALDALILSVSELPVKTKSVLSEIQPRARPEMVQARLPNLAS